MPTTNPATPAHTPVGSEFIRARARRRTRMNAQATVAALAAQGTLGANIITSEAAPRAASVDAGEKRRR